MPSALTTSIGADQKASHRTLLDTFPGRWECRLGQKGWVMDVPRGVSYVSLGDNGGTGAGLSTARPISSLPSLSHRPAPYRCFLGEASEASPRHCICKGRAGCLVPEVCNVEDTCIYS